MNKKIRVLSGIRASHGGLHLGNLLGAVEGMVELQNNQNYDTFYMVADLHGITTPYNPADLARNRIEIAKDYLAAGIDPKKSALFLQADVHEHAEFAFYLSSVVSIERLKHLPSYKEKIKKYPKHHTAALLNYPVLMAADILLYKASSVPLGADQEYHLEVAREIAKKMNSEYRTDFPEPERYIVKGKGNEITIPDIQSSGSEKKKMSKTNPNGAIFLNDSFDLIKRKVSKIPTSTAGGDIFPKEGGINTLYQLILLFGTKDRAVRFKEDYLNGSVEYGSVKSEIAELIYKKLKPIQERRREFDERPEVVKSILNAGAERARKVAQETIMEVKEKMGLL